MTGQESPHKIIIRLVAAGTAASRRRLGIELEIGEMVRSNRCCLGVAAVAVALLPAPVLPAEMLPQGTSAPAALKAAHFPDQLHSIVWRNWGCIETERIARAAGTTTENIIRIGRSMGLRPPSASDIPPLDRSYIGVIRRNWHLLPYEHMLTLLDWPADQLAYTLREDDFLWVKLGRLKPQCPPPVYLEPDQAAQERCARIRGIVEPLLQDLEPIPADPRFGFVASLSTPDPSLAGVVAGRADDEAIRFLYSYFAVYGDPLLNPRLDPYPDGLLQRLAAMGVNGVWLHVVLRQLAPSATFPEFGEGHQTRLKNLRELVRRAERYGVRIYLYMNEPRAQPESFYRHHEGLQGVRDQDHLAMCTSTAPVRDWIRDALTHVFREVPGLGGVFTITGSENLTNCHSHYKPDGCPRCSKRSAAEVIAEVNATIAEGVRRGNPAARVIVWDWGWRDDAVEATIRALPNDVYLMSVSEWDLPITRGNVSSTVGEYSISAVGPGPRATRHWAYARQRGLKTLAKVQVNCTWELSAVPYLPVLDLVARHMENLAGAGIDGLMLSWTLGGYPSENLRLASLFNARPAPSAEQALDTLARERYGEAAAPAVRRAWSAFSKAFEEFPFSIQVVYAGPMQLGPANLLYPEGTGYHATMVGIPYDNVDGWRAAYPADVFAGQFERVAEGWNVGLDHLRRAVAGAAGNEQKSRLNESLRLAEAAYTHFKSVANQVRFVQARDALLAEKALPARRSHADRIRAIVGEEIELATRLLRLARMDSRIGYEASNHYYYYPLDLVEKVVNCRYVVDDWLPRQLADQR